MRTFRSLVLELAATAWYVAVLTGCVLAYMGIGHLVDGNPTTDDGVVLLSASASVLLLLHPARVGLRELRVRWGLVAPTPDLGAAIRERAAANEREAREQAPRILLP